MGSSVVFSSFRATFIRTPKPFPLQTLPQTSRIFFLPRYNNYILQASSCYSSSAAALETASYSPSPAENCSWPEWINFVDRLKSRGYLVSTTTSSGDKDDMSWLQMDKNVLKNACLSFARDRFDVFNSLSKDDVQALVESGCPTINRKVVNSAKRLRACTGVDEADACGVCTLRGSCDRAYVTLQESESAARTVDIVRILLHYAYAQQQTGSSEGAKPGVREQAELSAKRLLLELVELSEAPAEPGLLKPTGNESSKKPVSGNVSVNKVPKKVNIGNVSYKKEVSGNTSANKGPKYAGTDRRNWTCIKCSFLNFSRNITCLKCSEPGPNKEAEIKKGDWTCSECNFMNFSRNLKCIKCEADGPKKIEISIEMKKGDWNCPQCGYMNFSNNRKCFRCTEARPPRDLKPGEWECPPCGFLNFRQNAVCLKCQFARPKENVREYK